MDALLAAADTALRTLWAQPRATRPSPAQSITQTTAQPELSPAEQQHAAGLMRVNHVGEICAQALYTAQALVCRNPQQRAKLLHAAAEETDHLAWSAQRLEALGGRASLLNPLWFAGAFGLGLLAGRMGDAISLGFVAETEHQVGAHLQRHLQTNAQGLPLQDAASRAVVAQMCDDELRHAQDALADGGAPLPAIVQTLMQGAAKVMTTVAYRV
jgi:ubiquinone biosynthesis monooxygenase Coq7